MEHIKSTELGYNYLRDRLILNARPLDFFMDSAFTEVDFNLENIINKVTEYYNNFIEKYRKYDYIFEDSKLKYGFCNYNDLWVGWTTTTQEKHLFLHLKRYESEHEFIERKQKTKRTPEEQELYEYHLQQKEIEKTKETLRKLDKEQLNTILSEIKND